MDAKQHDPFALPAPEILRQIEQKQNERAKQIREEHARKVSLADKPPDERDKAAALIQRNYRGYRERRALQGHGLDPGTRWLEALKDAQYHTVTRPTSHELSSTQSGSGSKVRHRWKRVGAIAHRAGSDDTSESENEGESKDEVRRKKAEREKYAKVMGLEYFLEMVDHKHRYGSNLRRYHHEWKQSDTRENFFYWLDYGEGKELDLEDRPRKRLDTEQVRYLSREERKKYLVRIDGKGRFCWDKDGSPITTSADFKDSIDGVVKAEDETPTWREVTTGEKPQPEPATTPTGSISSGSISAGSHEDASKYANEELHDAKGLQKLNHISVDSLMNHLLRKTTKSNTWIFVADTSFRLYIGIKQSGAFQHSSFLKGARVSAAGLIKIKRGQIRKLSPLSGHYAPPVKNFRQFVKALREAGADLSHLNISRSYAVILGLEGYVRVKSKAQHATRGVKELLDPEEKRKREAAELDNSQSAAKERRILEAEERERNQRRVSHRFKKRLGFAEGEQRAGDGGGDRESRPVAIVDGDDRERASR